MPPRKTMLIETEEEDKDDDDNDAAGWLLGFGQLLRVFRGGVGLVGGWVVGGIWWC